MFLFSDMLYMLVRYTSPSGPMCRPSASLWIIQLLITNVYIPPVSSCNECYSPQHADSHRFTSAGRPQFSPFTVALRNHRHKRQPTGGMFCCNRTETTPKHIANCFTKQFTSTQQTLYINRATQKYIIDITSHSLQLRSRRQ